MQVKFNKLIYLFAFRLSEENIWKSKEALLSLRLGRAGITFTKLQNKAMF